MNAIEVDQLRELVEKQGMEFEDACRAMGVEENVARKALVAAEQTSASGEAQELKKIQEIALKVATSIMLDEGAKPADRIKACGVILGTKPIEDEKKTLELDDLKARFERMENLSKPRVMTKDELIRNLKVIGN